MLRPGVALRRPSLAALLLLLLVQHRCQGTPSSTAKAFDVEARIGTHWKEIEAICPNRNYTSCKGVDRLKWTDASRTVVSPLAFNGLGAWSFFTLVTQDFTGAPRTKGGDNWFVLLRDVKTLVKISCRVFDNGDGTYSVAAYFLQPGNFTLWAWLWYSDCNGYQEPNVQFRWPNLSVDSHYVKFLQKEDQCYVGGKLRKRLFRVEENTPMPACAASTCVEPPPVPPPGPGDPGRTFRMEKYIYVKNYTFTHLNCCRPPRMTPTPTPTKRVMIFGDSTVANSWDIMMILGRRPCKVPLPLPPRLLHEPFDPALCPRAESLAEVDPKLNTILMRCTGGVPWTAVPIGTDEAAVAQSYPLSLVFDLQNFAYNDSHARNHKPPIPLPVPREFTFMFVNGLGSRNISIVTPWLKHIQPGDVAVINMGAHYSRTMTFDMWKAHIDEFAIAVKETIARTGATMVFRSSFMWKEHVFRSYPERDPMISWHFNTDARRLLLDSYAEHVLVQAGMHWWDIFGMCTMGEYRPHDIVHVDGNSVMAQNMDMMDLFACHP